MIVFNDILKKLADNGWSSYRLVKERVLPNSTIITLRAGRPIKTTTLDTICKLLNCQPGDLLSYVPDSEEKESL